MSKTTSTIDMKPGFGHKIYILEENIQNKDILKIYWT